MYECVYIIYIDSCIYIYIYMTSILEKKKKVIILCSASFLGGEQWWHYVLETNKKKKNSVNNIELPDRSCYPVHLRPR